MGIGSGLESFRAVKNHLFASHGGNQGLSFLLTRSFTAVDDALQSNDGLIDDGSFFVV